MSAESKDRKYTVETPFIFINHEKCGVLDYGWQPNNEALIKEIVENYTLNKDTTKLIKVPLPVFEKKDYDLILNELMEHIEKLNALAYKDAATGLLNRHAFKEEMNAIITQRLEALRKNPTEIENPEKYPPVTIAKIDLNYLKTYNDFSYIHGGDVALKYLSDFISEKLRKTDNTENFDTLIRFGGDELVVIMRGCTPEDANKKLKKISEDIAYESLHGEKPCIGINHKGQELPLQVSFAYGCSQLSLKDFTPTGDTKEDIATITNQTTDRASTAEAKNKEVSKKFAGNIIHGVPYCEDREKSLSIVKKYLEHRLNGTHVVKLLQYNGVIYPSNIRMG